MAETPSHWQIPLGSPPRIVSGAVSVHMPESRRDRTYLFPNFWTFHLYRHSGEIRIGDRVFELKPGCASLIAPNHEHHYRFEGRAEHAYVFVRLTGKLASAVNVPVVQNLGTRFLATDRALREAIGWMSTQPTRAAARVWDLLWQMADRTAPSASPVAGPIEWPPGQIAPAVQRALECIELRLQEPLSLGDLAKHADVSPPHLTRLFGQQLGITPVACLRRRRAARAAALLRLSRLTIKEIAGEVGIPDLHQFNKAMRRELGKSPREFRRADEPLPITIHHVREP